MQDDPRRRTPRTDAVLADERLADPRGRLGQALLKRTVAEVLERCRAGTVAPDDVVAVVLASLPRSASSLREVVNATGVVVHTNLGRAPLSAAAREAVAVAAGATDVELDLTTGPARPARHAARWTRSPPRCRTREACTSSTTAPPRWRSWPRPGPRSRGRGGPRRDGRDR